MLPIVRQRLLQFYAPESIDHDHSVREELSIANPKVVNIFLKSEVSQQFTEHLETTESMDTHVDQ